MEFQATHEPLYGFHLLQETKQSLDKLIQPVTLLLPPVDSFNGPAAGVNETHLIQLIQRPLETKRQQEP